MRAAYTWRPTRSPSAVASSIRSSLIDRARLGPNAGNPLLGAADYKLVHHARNGRSVYSFCMCPGGTVVAATSEPERVVTDGMSQYYNAQRAQCERRHLEGDDTDGHIDTLARFCRADTLAYQGCDDPQDTHYTALQAMAEELRALRQRDGKPYNLIELPWPRAKFSADGRRLPATYANFLIINDAVLVPTYRDAADAVALERLRGCFPDREVIGIDCLPLIWQHGSLHCVTMQIPEGIVN